MSFCWLIECRGYDLSIYTISHVCNFLRTLIDKKNNHINLRMIIGYSISNILKEHSLTRLRLSDNKTTLSLTYWREQIYNPKTNLIIDVRLLRLKLETFIWEYRSEMVKRYAVTHLFNRTTIYRNDLRNREILFILLRWTDRSLYIITWAQTILSNLLWR